MDEEDSPGRRFLRAAAADFERDLEQVFEDRLDDCSPQLRAHLFELWARARRRPAAPSSLEARFRELLERELDEVMLSSKLARIVVPGDVRLEQQGHLVSLKLGPGSSSTLEFPELASGIPDDELQVGLRKRLAREGLVADGSWPGEINYRPVRMHETSGTLVGVDVLGRKLLEPHQVDTLLWHDGTRWCFPRPRPAYDWGSCEHVQLFVDGSTVPEPHATLTWTNDGNEVEAVALPSALPTSTVKAVYTAVETDFF